VVFAFLIIPATTSALFTARVGRRLLITWGGGILGALLGLLFAHRLDFSVGPAVALFLGVELAMAGLWRRSSPLVAGPVAAVVTVGYVAVLAAAPAHAPRGLPETSGPSPTAAAPTETPAAAGEPSSEARPASVDGATSLGELAALFEGAGDTETRRDVVLRALELEPRCGAQLALRYLREDPPLFFRQGVVDGLSELADEPLDWDVMQPFAASVNEEVVARLEGEHRLGASPPPCR
jgi:hypothetical protein